MTKPILVALDGEPHTEAAITWALELAARLDSELVAVHVRDPYLKQFHNDIYAQGRLEYLAHVDDCLAEDGDRIQRGFETVADQASVRWRVLILDGDPCEQLAEESGRGDYALVILGRRRISGFAAWRSGNLPARLSAKLVDVPIMLVPGAEDAS